MAAVIIARGLGYRIECWTCCRLLPGVSFRRSDAAKRLIVHDRIEHNG
jgi:hypothetical protein